MSWKLYFHMQTSLHVCRGVMGNQMSQLVCVVWPCMSNKWVDCSVSGLDFITLTTASALWAFEVEKYHNVVWFNLCCVSVCGQTWLWVSGPLCLYCAERLFRYIRSSDPVTIVTVVRHPCDVIELRMLKKSFKARPGQVRGQKVSVSEYLVVTLLLLLLSKSFI